MPTRNSANTYIVPTADNEVTMPAQPAFLAYVSGDITNVTGDGTSYTVIFNAEQFDQGSNYATATGIFTVPITGKYLFGCNIGMRDIAAGHTSCIVNIVAGGQTTTIWRGNPAAIANSGVLVFGGSIFIQATAATTAYITVTVSGSTKVIDIQQFFTAGSQFYGYLIL